MNRLSRWMVLLTAIAFSGCGDAGKISSPPNSAENEPALTKALLPGGTGRAARSWDWDSVGIATGPSCDPETAKEPCDYDPGDPDPSLGCYFYNDYAPPLTWGIWKYLTSNLGTVKYLVTASPVGSTDLTGEVKYVGPSGVIVQQQFAQSIQFTAGPDAGSVEVRFMGNPYGTAVNGQICW